jgi:L-rhamnose-H+ transport protein
MVLILPADLHYYRLLSADTLGFIILGGFIFGIGQLCFCYAIAMVGVALSFTISLGFGVTIGSLFVVIYKSLFFTPNGLLVVLAVALIVAGLIIYYLSGKTKKLKDTSNLTKSSYQLGWLLAILAGIASGWQNITFVVVAFPQYNPANTTNSFWVWPPFLSAAAIPMFTGFLYRAAKTGQLMRGDTNKGTAIIDFALVFLMGLLFTGSLLLYSYGMSHFNQQQQAVGWPVFMVMIILTAQTWGWIFKENRDLSNTNKSLMGVSTGLFIAAVIILALAT